MRNNHVINMLFPFLCLTISVFSFGIFPVHADLIWPIPDFDGIPELEDINYQVLVNKENPLPENWIDENRLVHLVNSLGDDVEVERKTLDAYFALKDALAAENVFIDMDSAYRSVASQQRIMKTFMEKYGEDYAKQYVAEPGFSEHHTGLAVDLYLIIDGVEVAMNEDMVLYPEIWSKIHEKLPEFGFILRYPEGKEDITGVNYEPWHIRYIDDPVIAREITEKGLTLEEFLLEK